MVFRVRSGREGVFQGTVLGIKVLLVDLRGIKN